MPIYTYRPRREQADGAAPGSGPVGQGCGPQVLDTSCCHFDYLHLPGAPDSQPWQRCLTCGREVERVPSVFAATGLSVSVTARALRRAGCGDYAEAWEQSEREAATGARALAQTSSTKTSNLQSKGTQARHALQLSSVHVCTASCRHGSEE